MKRVHREVARPRRLDLRVLRRRKQKKREPKSKLPARQSQKQLGEERKLRPMQQSRAAPEVHLSISKTRKRRIRLQTRKRLLKVQQKKCQRLRSLHRRRRL